jgi:23S rRNA pseudouridine1911/1915/1917 synthase
MPRPRVKDHSRIVGLRFFRFRVNLALVRAEPVTGRTHQLRVHLAEYGLPVVGDKTYHGRDADRLMLHAHRLVFRHPVESREVTVEAPVPPGFKKLFDL